MLEHHLLGDKARHLMFRVGDGGATVEMKAAKGGYTAIWRWGSRRSTAVLTCQ